MRRPAHLPLFALALGTVINALGGCQALAGIKDRTAPSQQCLDYCSQAKAICAHPNTPQIYLTDENCWGICGLLAPGSTGEVDTHVNSVACRANQLADAAKSTEGAEQTAIDCINAAPGGNGTCGDDCDSYCTYLDALCPSEFQDSTDNPDPKATAAGSCFAKCKGLKDDANAFDVNTTDTSGNPGTGNYNGDTVQCRLVHLSAATGDAKTHCPHAQLKPNGPCTDTAPIAVDCQRFCDLETAECSFGNFAAYESHDQCMDVCKAFSDAGLLGTGDDTAGNTIGCRFYHSYNAATAPGAHCAHTGPGGDGHCGSLAAGSTTNCDSYCTLLQAACPADFTDQATCVSACAELDGAGPDSRYAVSDIISAAAATPTAPCSTVQERLLHVSRALSDPTECDAAVGSAACLFTQK